jgi:hypothetical protein
MGELRDHHVTAFVTGVAAEHLERERRRWDPEMADRIGGHVTVVYPEEVQRLDLLVARLRAACERTPPFPLRLGEVVAHEGAPTRGVHHLVADPVRAWAWLREFLLAPPFVALDVVAHATIAHPRTSPLLREAWGELEGHDPALEFRVGALHLVASDGRRWATVEEFPLVGVPAPPP